MANQYQQFINWAGDQYGTSGNLLGHIARLESGFNPNAVNNWDSNAAAGHRSEGLFQFIQPTFQAFSRQARQANPNAWKGMGGFNWKDWRQQALTTAWALKNGKGSHWATYQRALGAGKSPAWGQQGGEGSAAVTTPGSGQWVGGPDQRRVARIQNYWADDPTLASLKVQKYLDRNQAKWVETPGQTVRVDMGAPGFMGAVGGNYQNRFRKLADKFGLAWDSDAPWGQNPQQGGGKHADGSYHYSGRATDWGTARNSLAQLMQVARWARKHRSSIAELYFNQLGWGIRDGRVVKGLTAPGHDDHLHLAFR